MRTLKYIIGISLAVGLVACDDFLEMLTIGICYNIICLASQKKKFK